MGLLRFLLITITILWLIRLVARIVLPMIFQSFVKKAQQQTQTQYREPYRKPEGSINIDYIPPVKKDGKGPDTAGDFVDYEEIK